jgi:hypothetical protein
LQGGTWNRNGVILFALIGGGNPIFSVPAAGGTPTAVTVLDRAHGEIAHFWPHFLPDGNHFLYLAVNERSDRTGIYVARIGAPGATRLIDALSNVAYAEPGFLLFAREQTVVAQPFDARRLTITGPPVAIAEGVGVAPGNGRATFAASATGVFAYRPQNRGVFTARLTWFDRTGRVFGTVGPPNVYGATALSRDGNRVAAQIGISVGGTIWVADVARGLFTRLTTDAGNNESPVWSPDGTRIAFASNKDGNTFNIYDVAADGSTPSRLVFKSERNKSPLQWSDDGKWLVFESNGVWALRLNGGQPLVPIGPRDATTVFGQLSSDGQWTTYASNETGRFEVYVQRFPVSGRAWRVSVNGGTRPHWRKDGRELFFLGSDNLLYSVSMAPAEMPSFGDPVPLFATTLNRTVQGTLGFDGISVTTDGQRFLINSAIEDDSPSPVVVRLNWLAALKK